MPYFNLSAGFGLIGFYLRKKKRGATLLLKILLGHSSTGVLNVGKEFSPYMVVTFLTSYFGEMLS